MDIAVGYGCAFGAALCWGTQGIFVKIPAVRETNVDAVVFQGYYSLAIFLSSAFFPLFTACDWTWYGVSSALLWVPGSLATIVAITLCGLAVTQGVMCGASITVSFLWGVAYFQEDIRNWPWTLVGLSLLVVGVCGMCLSNFQFRISLPEQLRVLYRIVPCFAPPDGSYYAELDEMQTGRLLDADPENPLKQPESQFQVRQFLLGVVVAVISGASYGTTMVPKVLSREENSTGLCYGFCFGMGVGVFTLLVLIFYFIINFLRGKGIPALHLRVVLLPAMAAGFISNMGTVASIYATVNLGLTVGFPLTQMAVLVSGLWGLFLFKEMTRWNAIGAFFVSGVVLIGGAALLAVFAH